MKKMMKLKLKLKYLVFYKALGCNMSLEIHFQHSHLDSFPPNLGAVSDKQGELYHQEIATMHAVYCWMIIHDSPGITIPTKGKYHDP